MGSDDLHPEAPEVMRRKRIELVFYLIFFGVCAFTATRRVLKARGPEQYTDFYYHLGFARDMVETDKNLYLPPKDPALQYPHFLLVPLRLLQLTLPETLILILFGLSLGVGSVMIMKDLQWILQYLHPLRWLSILLFFVLYFRFFTNNFREANLSLWVGALSLRGIRLFLQDKPYKSGALVGLAGAMKLTPLVLTPIFFFHRGRRAALFAVALALFLVLVVPLCLMDFDTHLRHLRQFFEAMFGPMLGMDVPKPEWRWAWHSFSFNGTIDYLFQARSIPFEEQRVMFHVADLGDRGLAIVKWVWGSVIFGLAGWGFWRSRKLGRYRALLVQFSLALLLVALFAPILRAYHMIAAILPCALLCSELEFRWKDKLSILWWTTLILQALAQPLRQKALLGEQVWEWVDHASVQHFAIVSLLAWIALGVFRPCRSAAEGALSRSPASLD